MRKRSIFLAILVVALLVTVIAPTASAETRKLALISAKSTAGSQAVFTFLIYGEFNNFDGTAWYKGQAYDLRCAPRGNEPDVLLCRGAASLGGKTVQVVVSGFSFVTYVELADGFCHPVYDEANSGEPMWQLWEYYGDYCTPTQPNYGTSTALTGYYPGTWTYTYVPDGCGVGINQYGVGWYYSYGLCPP